MNPSIQEHMSHLTCISGEEGPGRILSVRYFLVRVHLPTPVRQVVQELKFTMVCLNGKVLQRTYGRIRKSMGVSPQVVCGWHGSFKP